MLRSTSGIGNEAERVRLRHAAGDDTRHVSVLIELGVVDAHVRRRLVAGRVLELDVGKFARHLEHLLHETERGGEDDLVALARQITEDALGVGAFGNLLDESRLHLVAEFGLDRLAPLVVSEGPAGVAHRADVNPRRLERLGLRRRRCGGRCRRCRGLGGLFLLAAAHERGGRSECGQATPLEH
jgi:hypothetical protein